jgi:chemotaxis protein CheD
VVVVETPTVVRTVLGSCVAVIFHVPRLRLSAICHAQMPERDHDACCQDTCPRPCRAATSSVSELRYVTCCVRYMLEELRRRWVDKSEIVCTLVGGANVLRNLDVRWSVADRNVKTALKMLRREGIKVRYRDTGGTRGRVIEHTCDLNRTKIRYHDGPA